MTLLRLTPTALARCRFALSPLAETMGALVALHRGYAEPWLARWQADNQPAYRSWLAVDEFAAGLLSLLAATKWLPDLVAPPPAGGMHTRLADELADVAGHSDAAVRAMMPDAIAASWEPQDTGWLAGSGLAGRIAAVFEQGWQRFVAPDWARRRAVLERDVAHRAGVLAAYGWQQAVRGMTRRSVWVGRDAIRFSDQDYPDRLITDEGLIFVPHTTGRGSWTCERPHQYALVYPARGPAAEPDTAAGDPLATLLGRGRARVLRELAAPATSSQLAQVLGVSLGTVSTHLAVLRDAGAVSRARAGRSVVYTRTDRGENLCALLAD
ncbi:transcriptional regulator [Actinocatenispora thailandica]|uniref:Transcriptional regulator n=1 Tax=Actinocatenispora thailandica TaxID=227318 RepID=A0A7R7HZS2_9ACTN|nr:winged helix-turn-helix domain-containing protein [Actinocatenispora thailandica]BCJ38583.1 transcriptional regulator [Actinocatenispora thailandica]